MSSPDTSSSPNPMRQIPERATQQHRRWLESSDHRAVATADPSPHPPPGISRDAYMRQRFRHPQSPAIIGLLLTTAVMRPQSPQGPLSTGLPLPTMTRPTSHHQIGIIALW
ncbi:hypothetical protein BDV38DRAFT_279918 [Aspergillus pseudotamarii]|uniref:Uncharacterized protein n=1 Tax=Aspergillus pseudotamarii TaxID=132259 RepID=A0A5N6T290_ASPPS|nr:uncharacterized protein BDV38DRAFT_279918 [Aspergillus pseudotamarii]KAE8140412.1 hypothetical protein BDV38DRAFT_279918 [Aspergillus pseudotamarii]